jgi:hypothetical protein
VRLALALSLAATTASAEPRVEVHGGGGLEGGTITDRPAPSGIAEVGLGADFILGHDVGFGVVIEGVARPGHDLAKYEESKLDVVFRYATPDRRMRAGLGGGVRLMQLEPVDGVTPPVRWGIDWIRLDGSVSLAQTTVFAGSSAKIVAVDGYAAWTLGCYLGHGDVMAEQRAVSCHDTITSTYVLGLAFSLRESPRR